MARCSRREPWRCLGQRRGSACSSPKDPVRLRPSEAMKLGALETKGYMDHSMMGQLDREGCCDGAPVGPLEALGASLGVLVGLVLTEGAAVRLGRLGAAEVARAVDTIGALDTEGPSDGDPVVLLEALGAPLGAPVGPPLLEGHT